MAMSGDSTQPLLPLLFGCTSRTLPCFAQNFLVKIEFFPLYFLKSGMLFNRSNNAQFNDLCLFSPGNFTAKSQSSTSPAQRDYIRRH